MSKDPAFLFYSSDFLSGTMLLSDEQTGKYIRLLCLQHQKGRLSEKDMIKICNTYDEDIFSKFIKGNDGLFYNMRLDEEIKKRVAYSESRRKNREKKEDMNNISNTYVEHMENENINTNKDKKEGDARGRFAPPSLADVTEYCKQQGYTCVSPIEFITFYESKNWMVGKNKMSNWNMAVAGWDVRAKAKPRKPAETRKRESWERPIGNYDYNVVDPFAKKYFERPTENYDHLAVDLFAEDAAEKYPQYADIAKDAARLKGEER
jgi:uncharacterized protein YdaU (DUF1376 family)